MAAASPSSPKTAEDIGKQQAAVVPSGAAGQNAPTSRKDRDLLSGPAVWVGFVCLSAVVIMNVHRPESQRALEDTARLERFVKMLAHAAAIPPNTSRQIEQLIRISYDCEKMRCNAAIATRNRLARSRLRYLLTAAALPDPDGPLGTGRLHALRDN